MRLRGTGTGTVVEVGDPVRDGPEFLQVTVTLNGTGDTLPFAPEDLAPAATRWRSGEAEPPGQHR